MIKKSIKIAMLTAVLFISGVANAQIATINEVGQKAFQILKSVASTSESQFVNNFLPARNIYEKIGGERMPANFYVENYNNLRYERIVWKDIKFIEFVAGRAEEEHNGAVGYSGTRLVFEYAGNKYTTQVAFFRYNNKYYLLRISDRIKNYSF